MPPKALRGAARGRGRGRGAAVAVSQAEISPPAPATHVADEGDIQPAIGLSHLPGPSVPVATPPQGQFDDADPSPNSSPASVPTETPAPTPARVPLTRSESSASGPAMSSTRVRGGARGGRGKNAAESKFKPKAIRRDAGELEELARKEQARLASIAATAARAEARAQRGRGRGVRGRGDVMGRGLGLGRASATASGIFSIVPEALQKKPDFIAKKSGGSGGPSGGGAGQAARPLKKDEGEHSLRTGGNKGLPKTNYAEPRYPDEDNATQKIDIELINLISDSDDEPFFIGSRLKSNEGDKKASGLKPVRLYREEHKERVTMVNTETVVKLSDGDDDSSDIEELKSSRTAPRNHADGKTRIKEEPDLTTGVDLSFRDSIAEPALSAPSSPESKRKTKKSITASSRINHDGNAEGKETPENKTRKSHKRKGNAPVIQTEEDKAEYERHLEDIAILANELGGLQSNLGSIFADAEGDVGMEDAHEETDKKEGRLYLFQFPPVLPELYNPINGKPIANVKVEKDNGKEKDRENANEKVKGKDSETTGMGLSSAKGKGKAKESIDLTADQPTIKVEEGIAAVEPKEKKEEKKKREDVIPEEGWIGKLVVRQSGRVELCWGGTNLLVGRGVDSGFLTTGVVVDMAERGPPNGGAPEGTALSMGQIMGKFVVTPDWEGMT